MVYIQSKMRHTSVNWLLSCFLAQHVGVSLQSKAVDLNCNFEIDLCNWKQDENNNFNWTISVAGSDIIRQKGDGQYIVAKNDGPKNEGTAALISDVQYPGNYCMTFWYTTTYSNGGTLNVSLLLSNKLKQRIFQTRDNAAEQNWEHSKLSIHSKENFQIEISAEFGGDYAKKKQAGVAVDDLAFISELCSPDCDFDTGWCGWTADGWSRYKEHAYMNVMHKDHTSEAGYFLSTTTSTQAEAAISSALTAPGTYCFSLWHRMLKSLNSLKIYTKSDNKVSVELVLEETPLSLGTWKYSHINFTSKKPFQIYITAVFLASGFVHIDDVDLSCGMCTAELAQFDCTFEHGYCGWKQSKAYTVGWDRTTGFFQGGPICPAFDHTTFRKDGYFICDRYTGAAITSRTLPSGEFCLSFWNQIQGNGSVFLRLNRKGLNQKTILFSKSGNQGNEWRFTRIQISSEDDFTLMLVADRLNNSDRGVAVDDIHICPGLCATDQASIDLFQPLASSDDVAIDLSDIGVIVNATTAVIFEVKCKSDARILLYGKNKATISVVLGSEGNSLSLISVTMEEEKSTDYAEKNIVTASAYRAFWISWNVDAVQVGKGFIPSMREFMRLNVLHDGITSLSVSKSVHSDVFWRFYMDGFPPLTTTSDPTLLTSQAKNGAGGNFGADKPVIAVCTSAVIVAVVVLVTWSGAVNTNVTDG